ncbi:MAG: hypothetical protein AAGG51_29230 [Cyanobacteria bacterium P01_G01_bin.54]
MTMPTLLQFYKRFRVHDPFTQEQRAYTISALTELLGAANDVFEHCRAIAFGSAQSAIAPQPDASPAN